jgi:hypothetical protein
MNGAWQFRPGEQPVTENHRVVVATRPLAAEIRGMLNLGPQGSGVNRAPSGFDRTWHGCVAHPGRLPRDACPITPPGR